MPAGRTIALVLGCVALAGAKLWLVHTDEVVASDNPYDQRLYAEMAMHIADGAWLGPYDVRALLREPSYPVWLAIVSAMGVPLRLAAELPLLAAASLVVFALRRRGLGAVAGVAVFGLVALHPLGLLVDREILPAGLYLPVLLAAVAGLWLAARGARAQALHGLWAGLLLGILWTLRPEKALVFLLLAVWSLVELLVRRGEGQAWRAATGRIALALAAVAIAAAVVPTTFALMNARHYGVFRSSDLSAPGFGAAYAELHGLPHRQPRPFLLMPRDARRLAYTASPAMRSLEPYLERPGWEAASSCTIVEVCDDLGGPFFLWALREAAAGHASSAAELDAFFASIAEELRAARLRGELPERRHSLHLVHPYPSTFVARLPSVLVDQIARGVSAGDERAWNPSRDHPGTDAATRALFDRVATRRQELVGNGEARVFAWIESPEDPVRNVVLRPRIGPKAARLAPVALGLELGGTRATLELWARKPRPRFLAGRPRLEIEHVSGATTTVAIPPAGGASERDGVRLHVERIEETGPDSAGRASFRRLLWLGHAGLGRALGVAAALALGVVLVRTLRGRWLEPLFAAALALGAVGAARLGMLALLGASTWPANAWRYLYPWVVPLEIAGMAIVALAWQGLRGPTAAESKGLARSRDDER